MPTYSQNFTTNLPVDTFAPTGLDVGGWLDTIVNAGGKYATLVAKHHQGFALWPTQFAVAGNDPYSIAQTTWYANNGQPDVVDLFVTGCRSRGLNPCLYFSIVDYTYETRSGTNETTDAAAYNAMVKTQLTELLSNYGDIYAIWFDGWKWEMGYEEIQFEDIYNFCKALQPDVVVIDNNIEHPIVHGQIEIYEGVDIQVGNTIPAEKVFNIYSDPSGFWFWWDGGTLRTIETINSRLAGVVARTGTFHLDLAPDQAGAVPADQATIYSGIVIP